VARELVWGRKGRVAFGVLRSGGVVWLHPPVRRERDGVAWTVEKFGVWCCGVEFAEPWARGCDWYDDVGV